MTTKFTGHPDNFIFIFKTLAFISSGLFPFEISLNIINDEFLPHSYYHYNTLQTSEIIYISECFEVQSSAFNIPQFHLGLGLPFWKTQFLFPSTATTSHSFAGRDLESQFYIVLSQEQAIVKLPFLLVFLHCSHQGNLIDVRTPVRFTPSELEQVKF